MITIRKAWGIKGVSKKSNGGDPNFYRRGNWAYSSKAPIACFQTREVARKYLAKLKADPIFDEEYWRMSIVRLTVTVEES